MQYRLSQLIGAQLATLGGVAVVVGFGRSLVSGPLIKAEIAMMFLCGVLMATGFALIFEEPSG